MFPHWEQPKFILKCAQPVLIAQGFKWSRCTAILTDLHALGAPLGAWKEGICGSTMPLYPTSGQWLPYRGLTWIKPLSLPLQHTYQEVVGSNPVNGTNILFWHKNSIACMKVWYPCSRWHSYLTSFTCNLLVLPRTFLTFFLLPLES